MMDVMLADDAGVLSSRNVPVIIARSPIQEPYGYVTNGSFSGPAVPESPDPLVGYRWTAPSTTDDFQIYLLPPKTVTADRPDAFDNLQSLAGHNPAVTVNKPGMITIDFGVESGAWVEFDSPDCPGDVELGISEYNEPGIEKAKVPVKYGTTYRLELNSELYEGVRFAFINVTSVNKPWHITGIRAVCQVKPTNYDGRFSCSDPLLTKIWYMAAYSVKVSLCKDYFGSILMDRGDRMSWTGDAHTTQAGALAAFGNFEFIRKNIDNTADQSNGIRSYSLYWIFSLLDYYQYTGDKATLLRYIDNAVAKLDDARTVFGTDPRLKFYGWDERLCAGFEIWFRPGPECQKAYKMLSIRAWKEFADVMGTIGRQDLCDKYNGFVRDTMAALRTNSSWYTELGIHAAADAITTGTLTGTEKDELVKNHFMDRVNRLSISPFNQYFILQAMARTGKYDDALTSVRDMWGGMIKYGATTTPEVFRPSWNDEIGPNDAVPNAQCGIVSMCHPWGAGVVKWLNEEILGIVPTKAGFAAYDILPHPGRTLTQLSGATPTPHGTISAGFDLVSGVCTVTAPSGTLGRIGVPKAGRNITSITINGTLAWDGAYHAVAGIGGASEDGEFVYFTAVKPGTHSLNVAWSGKTPAYDEGPIVYPAPAVKVDTITSGDWGGTYGNDGYVLCNYNAEGRDEEKLPAYVTSIEYFRAFPKNGVPDPTVWAVDTTERSALARNMRNMPVRNATGYTNSDQTMSLTIGIKGTRDYQVALYFVDWKNKGRRMAVEMLDAATQNLIAPVKVANNFSGGVYLIYKYNKSAKFRMNKVRGDVVSLSGIFFDTEKKR